MKKESHWFSHDSNAAHDPKLIALIAQQGMAAYGRWWRLVEILRAEEDYRYCITTRFAYSVLAKELMMGADEAQAFIKDCIEEYQLLQTDGEYIWSDSLHNRMQHLDKKRESYAEMGRRSGEARRNKKQTLTEPDSNHVQENNEPQRTNNNTEQNIKPQNNNKTEIADIGIISSPPLKGGRGMSLPDTEQLKQQLLQDERFTYPLISSGRVTIQQLGDWISAFNRTLSLRGHIPENPKDYRIHFINWFKFRDPQREDPHTFLLVPTNKPPVVIATQSFLKTAEQIAAEQEQQRNQWKEKPKENETAIR